VVVREFRLYEVIEELAAGGHDYCTLQVLYTLFVHGEGHDLVGFECANYLSEGRVKAKEEAHRDLEILGASEHCKRRFGEENYREQEAQVDQEASKSHGPEFIDHLKLILNIPSHKHSPEE